MKTLLIVAPILIIVVLGLAVLAFMVRRARARAQTRAAMALQGETIIFRADSASFLGLASKGIGQIRGNGLLILTDRHLWFHMWLPARELSIPRHRIRAITTPRSHLGKSIGSPLLAVELDDGDKAAWALRGIEEWVAALENWSITV